VVIFEYIPGGELFSRLTKSGRFSNDITVFYVSEILDAICYLHSHNIIFRDIKPENIMIDTTGHAKIIDLGFAKKLTSDRTHTLCGTPEYLAPEVLREQKAGYGKAVDYWGIGILAYELLAGYPPFYDA
jgi:serine/threonine protein kinase